MRVLLMAFILIFSASSALAQNNPPTRVVNGTTYIVHKVVSGETFYKIAKRYGCSVADLQAANKSIKVLKIGDEVLVPSKATAVVTPPANNSGQGDKIEYVEYTVKKGETLSKIARDHSTTVEELKKINNLGTAGLKIGQVIKVPAPKKAVGTNPPVKQDTAKPKEPVQDGQNPDNNQPKPVEIKQPVVTPPTPKITVAETAVEKEEIATARVLSDKMDQTRTFVMHPSLPKGSIIVLINEETGKMAYCRVIDNIRDADLGGAGIAITQAVADKLGFTGTSGGVKIKYAAP